MTLREACEFGYDCGLKTLKEAIVNIQIHANSLFCYDKIDDELHELYVKARKYSPKMSIEECLNGETSD